MSKSDRDTHHLPTLLEWAKEEVSELQADLVDPAPDTEFPEYGMERSRFRAEFLDLIGVLVLIMGTGDIRLTPAFQRQWMAQISGHVAKLRNRGIAVSSERLGSLAHLVEAFRVAATVVQEEEGA